MCECQMKFRRREKAFGDWMDAKERVKKEEKRQIGCCQRKGSAFLIDLQTSLLFKVRLVSSVLSRDVMFPNLLVCGAHMLPLNDALPHIHASAHIKPCSSSG